MAPPVAAGPVFQFRATPLRSAGPRTYSVRLRCGGNNRPILISNGDRRGNISCDDAGAAGCLFRAGAAEPVQLVSPPDARARSTRSERPRRPFMSPNSVAFASYIHRGLAHNSRGELDKAIADYTEAMRIDPRHVEAYNNRSVAYMGKGQYDKAIADCNVAIRLEPTLASAVTASAALPICSGASTTKPSPTIAKPSGWPPRDSGAITTAAWPTRKKASWRRQRPTLPRPRNWSEKATRRSKRRAGTPGAGTDANLSTAIQRFRK